MLGLVAAGTIPGGAGSSVAAAPTITSFSPGSGGVGSTVTISGSGFTGATQVSLCLVQTTFTVSSSSKITAQVPAGACNGLWRVTTASGTAASSTAFTVSSPTITAFSPTSGAVGSSITITGTNFSGATSVSLCLVATSFNVVSATKITATVPAGACNGLWRVTTPSGTAASASAFTLTSAGLAVSGFAPASAPVGGSVTISGSGFSGATQVSLCLVPTSYTVVSSTSITATVPVGACDGLWRVTTSAGTAASTTAFTVSSAPALTITDFSPSNGSAGTTVIINGSGFTGATAVSLCMIPALFNVFSPTTITATVPAGACDGYWRVTTPAGTAVSASTFASTAPRIDGFTPGSGPVGTPVTITGANFSGVTQVSLCLIPTTFTVVSSTSLTASVPNGACDGLWRVSTAAGTAASGTPFVNSATLDTQAPITPTGLAVTGATTTSISVSWTASTDNVGVTGYGHYVNGTLVTTSAGTNYTFSGLTCGTTYTLGVDAVDAAGNRSAKTQITAGTTACSTPTFLLGTQTLGPMSDYNPQGWAETFASVASASGTVGGLHVYVDSPSTATSLVVGIYANASGSPGTLLGQGSTTTLTPGAWNDVRLPNVNVVGGTTYWIALLAPSGTLYYRDSCCGGSTAYVSSATNLTTLPSTWSGSSAYSSGPVAAYSFAPLAPDTSAPTPPTALTTSGTTQTSVSLSWAPATDDVGVTGYGIYVNNSLAGSSGGASYTVSGLSCGTNYSLAVDAVDAAGNRSTKTSIAAATASCSAPPPPPGPASVFVSPSGSDSNACTSTASPCKTFDRAYHVAAPGQIIEVAGGSYPDQTLGPDSSKNGPGIVTFQPAAGASVTIADLYVEGASYVKFTSMTVGFRFHVENTDPTALGSTNVTFDSIKAQTFDVVGRVANVTVHGGSFGNTTNHQPQITKFNQSDPNAAQPLNTIIEDAVFQNFHASDPSIHTECLQVLNANGLTVRRNKFSTCDSTGDLGLTCEPGTTNITIENNWLMAGGNPGYGAQISGDCSNLNFRYNSAVLDVFFADSVNAPPYKFVGNYMNFNSLLCRSSGVTYSHNVMQGGTCGSSDANVPTLDFLGALDLHLKAGANAINKGDPADYPSTDIDGIARPRGSAPDAGAVEAG